MAILKYSIFYFNIIDSKVLIINFSLLVAQGMAVMAGTLAHGGICPLTGERVRSSSYTCTRNVQNIYIYTSMHILYYVYIYLYAYTVLCILYTVLSISVFKAGDSRETLNMFIWSLTH